MMFAAGALLAAFSFLAPAQQPRGTASQQYSAAPATATPTDDFTADGMKFHKVPGTGQYGGPAVYQVVDVASSNPAGQLLVRADGSKTAMNYPGFDKSKIEAAFNSHANNGSLASASIDNSATSPHSTLEPPVQGFDAATKTVTLSDGRAVIFTDSDNLKVQMPGPAGAKIYALHFHKASAGGVMQGWAGRAQGRVGGSLGGGGVTISLESQGGMPGGEVYDTAKGTVYGNSGFVQAKAVTAVVREATEIAKSGGQPDLAKLHVVKSLLSNNLGM